MTAKIDPDEVVRVYGQLPVADMQTLIEGLTIEVADAMSFAFDCADVENWDDMHTAILDSYEAYEKMRNLTALFVVRVQEKADDAQS